MVENFYYGTDKNRLRLLYFTLLKGQTSDHYCGLFGHNRVYSTIIQENSDKFRSLCILATFKSLKISKSLYIQNPVIFKTFEYSELWHIQDHLFQKI